MRRVLFVGLLTLWPSMAVGQDRECTFSSMGRAEGVGEVTYFHDPFVVVCADGAELRASSGRLEQAIRVLHLSGNVYFRDGDRTLTAIEATYNNETAFLHARGNVVFSDVAEGTTLRGPELEYYRETDFRPVSQMRAVRRPVLTLSSRERTRSDEPIELTADRIDMRGDDDLTAIGSVVVTRSDFDATAGEVTYDAATEYLELKQDARILSEGRELRGEVVQARMAEGAIEHLRSRTNASLRGDDLFVNGEELQLFFVEELLQRATAIGGPGPESTQASATSPEFRLSADSVEAFFEQELLKEVHAIGSARGESIDTLGVSGSDPNLPSSEAILATDWIRGDTILGYFVPRETADPDLPERIEDSVAPPDADGEDERTQVDLRKLIAIGDAQSLYRMRGENDPEGERRNINFLVGQRIELDLVDSELSVARVTGLQQGIYLEPDTPQANEGAVPAEPAPPAPSPAVGQ